MKRVGCRRAPLGGLRQTAPSERPLVTACAAALTPAWRIEAGGLAAARRTRHHCVVKAALKPASHPNHPMNRNVLTAELEAAHDAHQLPKPCPRCYQLDRARPGGEFQMYRCARCVAAKQAAQLALWRAQWRILNRHRKAIVEVTRGDRLDVAWLTQRMHHLEVAAKSLAALTVVDTLRG